MIHYTTPRMPLAMQPPRNVPREPSDWTVRENIRANLRVLVKRILRKYGYPPDKQEKATLTVLEQAEALSANWATA